MSFDHARKAVVAVRSVLWSLAISALAISGPAMAQNAAPSAAMQFEKMTTLVGEWQVQDQPALRIIFEPTAGGSVIVERWMVGVRMHSMTVYHRDGEALMATHYCPQGNQPRLKMDSGSTATRVSFDFHDATNLQSLEQSHQHRLSFDFSAIGQVTRGEAYRQEVSSNPTAMVLSRVK